MALAELRPLALVLREQGPTLARALRDADGEVRGLAAKGVEEMGQARWRWLRLASRGGNQAESFGEDPLLAGLQTTLPGLGAAAGGDPEVRVRRAAMDALEILGPAAAPAVPVLVRGLADPDRSTRWSAVRILGGIGPSAGVALPALAAAPGGPGPRFAGRRRHGESST